MENFQSQVSDVEVEDDDSEEEKDENDQESQQQQEEEGDNEEAAPEGDNDGQQEEDDGEDAENNDDENEEEEEVGEDDADDDNEEQEEEENEVDQDENNDTIKDESDVLFVGEKKSVSINLAANISGDIEEKKKATKKRKAGTMVGDIQEMMYGFGDTHFPANEDSVALIQSLITNYIEDLTWRAAEVADIRSRDSSGNGRIDKDSFLFLVRKDKAKFNRVFKLLKANDELKAAQKLEIREDHPSML